MTVYTTDRNTYCTSMIDFFMSPYFNLPIGFIFIIIFTVLTGLIVAGILQKEKEHPF